jgi:DNA-binding transcriptional ArsR family regulator
MLVRGEMVNEASEKKGSRPAPAVLDQRLAKALAHPTRVQILSILNEGPSSPSKIAKRLNGVSLNLTSHHIKVLRDLGCVELVKEVTHGGRTEHVYRATKRQHFTPAEWEEVEPHTRPPITVSILRLISEDVGKSLASGKFDELPDNHLSRSPLDVDQEGWREIVSILNRTLDEVLEVNVRSAERVRLSGEELTKIRVVMMQFLMDPERT